MDSPFGFNVRSRFGKSQSWLYINRVTQSIVYNVNMQTDHMIPMGIYSIVGIAGAIALVILLFLWVRRNKG